MTACLADRAASRSTSRGRGSWASSTSRPTRSPTAARTPTPARRSRTASSWSREGADILDIGGESTPARAPRRCRSRTSWRACCRCCATAVDARRAGLGRHLQARGDARGARPRRRHRQRHRALRSPGALEAWRRIPSCGVCLMHMHGDAATDAGGSRLRRRRGARSRAFLRERIDAACGARASAASASSLDPGIGFGKTLAQNFALLARQDELLALGVPLLVGWSRKSTLGARRPGSAGAGERTGAPAWPPPLLAVQRGARIVRVHDVAATVDALAVWQARATPIIAPTRQRRPALHEQNVFRHRRHPRHGRPGADHARLRAAPRRTPSAGCCAQTERAPDRPDRQGHAHLRLHARVARSRRASPRPASTWCCSGPLPTPGVAYLTRALRARAWARDQRLAQPVRRQRHQVLLGAQASKLPDAWEAEVEAALRRAADVGRLGRARQGAAARRRARAATSSSARARSPTT